MEDNIKHVRKLRSEKKYVESDEYFLELKNSYLERLKNRDDVCSPAFSGLTDIIFDPRDDFELQYCQSILGFQDDVREIKNSCSTGDIKMINLDDSYAVKSISECIKLMSVDEVTPEVYDKICAIDSAKLMYETLVLGSCDKDNFFNRLVTESGYDLKDEKSLELFSFFYSMFYAFLGSVETSRIMRISTLDNVLDHEMVCAHRFHKLYLNGLSSNCTIVETYKGNNFEKSLK